MKYALRNSDRTYWLVTEFNPATPVSVNKIIDLDYMISWPNVIIKIALIGGN